MDSRIVSDNSSNEAAVYGFYSAIESDCLDAGVVIDGLQRVLSASDCDKRFAGSE